MFRFKSLLMSIYKKKVLTRNVSIGHGCPNTWLSTDVQQDSMTEEPTKEILIEPPYQ
jgi:hypothetical protein